MDIIERAARAICYSDRDYQFCANNCRVAGKCVGEITEVERAGARAVLEAIRDPDEGMVEAAGVMAHTASCVWHRMIDAALKG